MYAVSQSYIDAVRATTREERLVGVLVYPDGEELPLTQTTLGQNSVKITHACTEGEEIQFGGAISSELQISVRSEESRYRFYGAKVRLTYGIQTTDGWEDIPLGEFNVAEPERKQSVVMLTAYDNLIHLDKEYGDRSIYGTPFEIMTAICEDCGVVFGMTEKEVLAFPNGDQYLQIDADSGANTYRAAAKILAQLLACFVVADRNGHIVFRRYGKEVVATLAKTNRYSLTAADYHCKYVGVTVKSSTHEITSYDVDAGEGLELTISNAAAWDHGLDTTLQARTDNLLNELKTIQYTPSTVSAPGDPALDCGDLLELLTDDGSIITLVTEYTWSFHGRMSVKSKGVNPYLKTVEPQKAQEIRKLEKSTESNKLIFYSFSNNAEVVAQSEKSAEVAQVFFVTTAITSAMFMAQLPLLVECEGYVDVQVEYYLNGTLVDYPLIQRCYGGPQILGLFYTFSSLPGGANFQWQVKIRLADGSGTVTVPKRAFRATVTGQGMAGTGAWDGTLSFDENVPVVQLGSPTTLRPVVEECTAETQIPVASAIQESMPRFGIASRITLKGFAGEVVPNPVWEQQTISAQHFDFAERYVALGDKGVQLRTVWQYRSAKAPVDAGSMTVVKAVTSDLMGVEEVLVNGV